MRSLMFCLCICFCIVVWPCLGAQDIFLDDFGYDVEMQFKYYSFAGHDEFSLANFDDNWDSSERYELVIAMDDFWQGRSGFYAAYYLFWEEREWQRGNSYLDVNAFGGGVEAGGRFWLLVPRDRPALNIALAPYGRLGFAFQDVDFEDVPDGANAIDGAVDVERIEFVVGVDVLGRIGHNGQISAGVGAQFWISDQVAADINGTPVSTESFNGDSLFYRFSAGIRF